MEHATHLIPITSSNQSFVVPNLSTSEVAKMLSVSSRTLQRMREAEEGPPYYRLGRRRVSYCRDAVLAWIASREQCARKNP